MDGYPSGEEPGESVWKGSGKNLRGDEHEETLSGDLDLTAVSHFVFPVELFKRASFRTASCLISDNAANAFVWPRSELMRKVLDGNRSAELTVTMQTFVSRDLCCLRPRCFHCERG